MQDSMAAELSRTARQARAESERELEQKQTKISSLSRENDKLQNEVQTAFVWYSTCYRESESDSTATSWHASIDLQPSQILVCKESAIIIIIIICSIEKLQIDQLSVEKLALHLGCSMLSSSFLCFVYHLSEGRVHQFFVCVFLATI